jgi:hypothetical protein
VTGIALPQELRMPGTTIDELTVADEPANWAALGFSVSDHTCQLGTVRIRFADPQAEAARGIVGWSLREIESTELDGLPTSISDLPPPTETVTHPNGALAIDHVVAFSPAFERSVGALRLAGLDLRRVRDEPTPTGAPRQAFFRLGKEVLELVQEPEEAVSRLGGPDHPARFWGLAVLVEDIDRSAEMLGEHVSAPRQAVQEGRRIATIKRSAGLTVPLALMSPDERGREKR